MIGRMVANWRARRELQAAHRRLQQSLAAGFMTLNQARARAEEIEREYETARAAAAVAKVVRRGDRRRVRRDPWRLTLIVLEKISGRTSELCRAYGGILPSLGAVRLCDKPRWHWDSHAFGRWELPDGTVLGAVTVKRGREYEQGPVHYANDGCGDHL